MHSPHAWPRKVKKNVNEAAVKKTEKQKKERGREGGDD